MVKELLEQLGYDKNSIKKIMKWNSTSLEDTLYAYIINTFEYLESKGYSKKDIIKMTKSLPTIFSYSEETIENKFKYLESKRYSKQDIIKMTKLLPAIFGYSKQDIIKMTKSFPSIFALSEENIDKKIEFYKEIDLEFIITENTLRLMQSVELTYARYRFFSDMGIIVNQDNYLKLFVNQKKFIKQYGINNNELINRYPYNQKVLIREV